MKHRLFLGRMKKESLSVVRFQIHLLDFFDQRIARIGAGALVVERLLCHVVQPFKEIDFVNYRNL